MFLEEWKQKPRNKYIILLGKKGDLSIPTALNTWRYNESQSDFISDMMCCVYNVETDRVSDKSVYVDKNDRAYIKCKNDTYSGKTEKLYLSDFFVQEGNNE